LISKILVVVDGSPYAPNFKQMVEAYEAARDSGLKNVRLGNVGLFAKTTNDYETPLSIGAL